MNILVAFDILVIDLVELPTQGTRIEVHLAFEIVIQDIMDIIAMDKLPEDTGLEQLEPERVLSVGRLQVKPKAFKLDTWELLLFEGRLEDMLGVGIAKDKHQVADIHIAGMLDIAVHLLELDKDCQCPLFQEGALGNLPLGKLLANLAERLR